MRIRNAWIWVRCAAACGIAAAVLGGFARTALAQSNPFDRYDAPPLVNNFGGGTVRSLEREFQADLYVLGAFDGRRRVDRYDQGTVEREQPWKFYGRLGPMHFQNQLEPTAQGLQFSWRRTGPSLGGRIYIGIHRTFH